MAHIKLGKINLDYIDSKKHNPNPNFPRLSDLSGSDDYETLMNHEIMLARLEGIRVAIDKYLQTKIDTILVSGQKMEVKIKKNILSKFFSHAVIKTGDDDDSIDITTLYKTFKSWHKAMFPEINIMNINEFVKLTKDMFPISTKEEYNCIFGYEFKYND